MAKRIFLLVGAFVICAAGTYTLLKPNPKKQIEKALLSLKEGDYYRTETLLKELPSSPTLPPPSFFRGYLEQARGRYSASDIHFLTAFNSTKKKGGNQGWLAEITLARALNAYFEERDSDLSFLIDSARASNSCYPVFLFFDGLDCYLQRDYAGALHLWNHSSFSGLGEWMHTSLVRSFSETWQRVHRAHCLIEEGHALAGRELLEKEELNTQSPELHPLSTLFLGLSYLIESHAIPFDQRGSYYQLARFYFERGKVCNRFAREKNRIVTHIEEEAKGLLLADLDEEKRKWGFDFIHTLQEWRAEAAITRLSELLAEKVLKQKGAECIQLCASIRNEFLGTPFHLMLTQNVLSALTQELKEADGEALFELWALIESLSSSPKLAAKQIAALAASEIFDTVNKDDAFLTRTRSFLLFWEKLGTTANEQEVLAHDLFCLAKLFWLNGKEEQKGVHLMELALKLSGHSPSLSKEISSFLTDLYTAAENSNMIGRLTLLYDAMEYFEISRQELVSKTTLANHLADAEYLYEAHNFPAAKMHAGWVLKLDPQNEGARRLLGLCSFHLGEYSKALCHLKALGNPDEDALKALTLSYAFSSQEQPKELCSIEAGQ
jgi:hypothetical protein